jgi:hypothetical protein
MLSTCSACGAIQLSTIPSQKGSCMTTLQGQTRARKGCRHNCGAVLRRARHGWVALPLVRMQNIIGARREPCLTIDPFFNTRSGSRRTSWRRPADSARSCGSPFLTAAFTISVGQGDRWLGKRKGGDGRVRHFISHAMHVGQPA